MKIAVFIFRRDLRLFDNTSLIKAIMEQYIILPIFIFTPEQIEVKQNKYFSNNSVQFMCESLESLNESLIELGTRLYYFYGTNIEIINKIYTVLKFDAIISNCDYSFYSRNRDLQLQNWAKSKSIVFKQYEDYGLLPLMDCLQGPNKPYVMFSPFFKRVLKEKIRIIATLKFNKVHFVNTKFAFEYKRPLSELYKANNNIAIRGGRKEGLIRLNNIKSLTKYNIDRNYMAKNATSKLSPHLKFGTISIREMYWAIKVLFGNKNDLLREIIFREFYLKIYALYPQLQRGVAYSPIDKKIKWLYDKKLFAKWATGKTGIPIVDAGMRELVTTGYQHNRVRMICASVLTKYLLIDWRLGLKFYYMHLVDADIYSNTAGWGYCSSTGPDSYPPYRIPFNPFTQSKKFDKDTQYIKKWLPELETVIPKHIHKWYSKDVRDKYKYIKYPAPIVDHVLAGVKAVKLFNN